MRRWEKTLWMLTVAWGALLPWFSLRPAMNDLPQFAGHVALLGGLLRGTSSWSDQLWINLATPYLSAYGLALAINQFLPILPTVKLVLSISYLLYVTFAVIMRRHLKADARLDWLIAIGFFGYAYQYGFVTFLLACAFLILFLWLFDRNAMRPTVSSTLYASAAGLLVLVSHGLAFMFAFAVCCVMLLMRPKPSLRAVLWRAIPLFVGGAACVGYFIASKRLESRFGLNLRGVSDYGFEPLRRVAKLIVFPFDNQFGLIWLGCGLGALLAPWLIRARPQWGHRIALVPIAMLLLAYMMAPSMALSSASIYQRFSLLILPAYAWSFQVDTSQPGRDWRAISGSAILMGVAWLTLLTHSIYAYRFSKESADFEVLLQAARPAERALYLPFDSVSKVDGHKFTYAHYAVWYEAERGGFVDVNFAWFPPQIVRFIPGHTPRIGPGFETNPGAFDWVENQGQRYRYFFVRGEPPGGPEKLFRGAPCPPAVVASSGLWSLYENGACNGPLLQ